jgi:hypothetical protein
MGEERTPEHGVEFRAVAQFDLVKQNTLELYIEGERWLRDCLSDAQQDRPFKNEDRFIGTMLTLYFDVMGKADYIKEYVHTDDKGKRYHIDDLIGYLRYPQKLKFKEGLEYFILLRIFLEKQGFLFVETPRYALEEMILRGLEKRQ